MKQILGVSAIILLLTALALFVGREFGFHKYRTQDQLTPIFSETDKFYLAAHRGGAGERPENTILAFENASLISPDILLELDVQLTKDLELVVIHDATVDRTTDGTGFVKDLTLAEIQNLDAGSRFTDSASTTENPIYPYKSQGVKIPTLKEVLLKFPSYRFVVEVKPNEKSAAEKLISIVEETKSSERVLIGSEHFNVIQHIRAKKPSWKFTATAQEIFKLILLKNMWVESTDPMTALAFFVPETSNGIPVLSPELMLEWKRRGKPVVVWTINEEKDMHRLIDLGVNGIVTDFPSRLATILKSKSLD
jgi:glycerophosphoryl diester phosphodiesterase